MRRLAPALALGGAALVAVAGCGAQSTSSLGNVKLAAAEAVQQSVQKAEAVTSYSADVALEATGGDKGTSKIQGSLLYQSRPQLATDVKLDTITYGGQNVPGGARAILSGDTVYVKSQLLNKFAGAAKPWVKVSLTDVNAKEQAGIKGFMDQIQQFDLASTVKLLTASKDVKAVGTETVGGVDTTHYSGTFPVAEAAQVIDPAKSAQLQRDLSQAKNVKFDFWADAQSLPRKVALSGAQQGATFNLTAFFKGFNEPVEITAPPADQVSELPKNHVGN
ncbi:LppX_LprAFG lipoprotein [Streptosporangium lutulentum]|uniref:Outer membrane lipoprotein-sorting protein n=1 Tax=Streptosporangium lutulentum TaxID=1461250 RepID=A0ABT9QJ76_9ACTN|nr:LppX_LprAFG lipoprotein [Streptosporangium lutulentum]MDP9846811.1 outer membrane lipoprotein-sorting protein [Streptosporangium lutulentum]